VISEAPIEEDEQGGADRPIGILQAELQEGAWVIALCMGEQAPVVEVEVHDRSRAVARDKLQQQEGQHDPPEGARACDGGGVCTWDGLNHRVSPAAGDQGGRALCPQNGLDAMRAAGILTRL
jgi:hypothetical protein